MPLELHHCEGAADNSDTHNSEIILLTCNLSEVHFRQSALCEPQLFFLP